MKNHYWFINRSNWMQKAGETFLEDKLDKGIKTLTREVENILESRSSKSSLSSNSLFDQVESMDWLLHDRSEAFTKDQEKIEVEIRELEKILEDIQ